MRHPLSEQRYCPIKINTSNIPLIGHIEQLHRLKNVFFQNDHRYNSNPCQQRASQYKVLKLLQSPTGGKAQTTRPLSRHSIRLLADCLRLHSNLLRLCMSLMLTVREGRPDKLAFFQIICKKVCGEQNSMLSSFYTRKKYEKQIMCSNDQLLVFEKC